MSYREQFSAAEDAARYDEVEYGDDSYAAVLWSIEREQLDSILHQLDMTDGFRYLDFACGTGRVLAHVTPRAGKSTGIEISPAMAARAQTLCPQASVLVKDVTAADSTIESTYDVITAFRFVLNAEPTLRRAALEALRRRLATEKSVLLVNNHGNLLSHKAVFALPHALRRAGRRKKEGNLLTHRAFRRICQSAGLSVERAAGCGLLGGRAAARLPHSLVTRLETAFARSPLSRLGSNQIYVCRAVEPSSR